MSYNMMIRYDDIYDRFTMEHFPQCQSMILRISFFLLATVLLRPKNFVRHFQGPDMKCKLPLSTNNLALLSLLSF
jgi:hypothetical protein